MNQISSTTKIDYDKQCELCLYFSTCQKYEGCEFLNPTEATSKSAAIIEKVEKLRRSVLPSMHKRIRNAKISSALSDDGITPLGEYYATMINDALRDIRRGQIAYLYSLQAIKDIFRFEPAAHVEWQDDVFYISLKGVLPH